MNESKFTQGLHAKLKEDLGPKCMVLKHSDRFTKGVPDSSVSGEGNRTFWFEIKVLRKKSQRCNKPKTWIDNKLQLYILQKLGGYYLVFDPKRHEILFEDAKQVRLGMTLSDPPWGFSDSIWDAEEEWYEELLETIGGALGN